MTAILQTSDVRACVCTSVFVLSLILHTFTQCIVSKIFDWLCCHHLLFLLDYLNLMKKKIDLQKKFQKIFKILKLDLQIIFFLNKCLQLDFFLYYHIYIMWILFDQHTMTQLPLLIHVHSFLKLLVFFIGSEVLGYRHV